MEQKLILFCHFLPEYGDAAFFPVPSERAGMRTLIHTHTHLFLFLFGAGMQIPHVPHTHSLFLSPSPKIVKTLERQWRDRGIEAAAGRGTEGKQSTHFNSPSSSGRPLGMEG